MPTSDSRPAPSTTGRPSLPIVVEEAPTHADQAPPSGAPLRPGTKVGRYTLLELLGAGGMGIVYAAYDPELDRRVALKIVPICAEPGDAPAAQRERVIREARVLAQLSHPHVVAVYDVGSVDAGVFIAMELVTGQTLRRWWRTRRELSWALVKPVFLAAAEGLAASHRASIVHQDVKPENIVVGDDGRVRVVDFGVARIGPFGKNAVRDAPRTTEGTSSVASSTIGASSLASSALGSSGDAVVPGPSSVLPPPPMSGRFAGTPEYMAPEQRDGELADARSDQYAFCVTLYEVIFGRRPPAQDGESTRDLTAASRRKPKFKVPAHVLRAVKRGLSGAPDQRFPSMDALIAELSRDPHQALRRAGGAVAVLVALAAGVGLTRAATAERALLCRGGAPKLAAVWNDAARSRMRDAFLRTARPWAADVLSTTVRALDAYGTAWVRMHDDACEATRLRGEQSEELLDARMACLTRNLDQLTAQVELFTAADESTVERAPIAAQQLPPVDACGDIEALRGAPGPPRTAEGRARYDELSRRLATARALSHAGRYEGALRGAAEARELARAAALPSFETEALALEGRVRVAMRDGATASKILWSAFLTGTAARDDERAADALAHLVFSSGDLEERHDEARRYYELAQATLTRVGRADLVRGSLLRNWAVVLTDIGRYDEGLGAVREALVLMERAVGSEHVNFAATLETLGVLLRAKGDFDGAIATQRRALAVREKAFGPRHPFVAISHYNLGMGLGPSGHRKEALEECETAGRILANAVAPEHTTMVDCLMCMAEQLRAMGSVDRAKALDEDALARNLRSRGPDALESAYTLQSLSEDALASGDGASAQAYAERALRIMRASLPPDSVVTATTLGLVGRALLAQGKYAAASAELNRALADLARSTGAVPLDRADVIHAAGEALLALGQGPSALSLIEEATTLRERYETADPVALADSRFALARALRATKGDEARARAAAHAALETYRRASGPKRDRSGDVERWLAGKGR